MQWSTALVTSCVPWALLLCALFCSGWDERCIGVLGSIEVHAYQSQLLGCPGKDFFFLETTVWETLSHRARRG